MKSGVDLIESVALSGEGGTTLLGEGKGDGEGEDEVNVSKASDVMM